jgi:hypothetical protein
VLERFAREVRTSLTRSHAAGHSNVLIAMVVQVLRSGLSLQKVLLGQYATRRRVGLFLRQLTTRECIVLKAEGIIAALSNESARCYNGTKP